MPIINRIADFHADMTAWRRELHQHPELSYEERWTSDFVAKQLESFGIEVTRGIAVTGLVGKLVGRSDNGKAIALRADMDALPINEANEVEHKSLNPGRMHACGHDGHTTMLLGAAKYLAETRNFDGTVYFVFQPAEEGGAGGDRMVKEGLFERFPVDTVWGMHNIPGMDVGTFAVKAGPMMAGTSEFDITVHGRGGHAAMAYQTVDPILVASEVVGALQSIASRNTHPLDSVVVSVTQIHAGDAYNVIPPSVALRGTVRTYRDEVTDLAEARMRQIVDGITAAHGGRGEVDFRRGYPATVNHEAETEVAARVAAALVGDEKVNRNPTPSMGGEDFAYMLNARPGSYIWIGNGPAEAGAMLHNPGYDFNDEALPLGASYWSKLVEMELPRAGG
ncbi:MAG TPA: M20 aminoacylase family protein [Thalassobaculum sp.]